MFKRLSICHPFALTPQPPPAAQNDWESIIGTLSEEQSDAQKPDDTHKASHGSTVLDDATGDLLRRFFAPHNKARSVPIERLQAPPSRAHHSAGRDSLTERAARACMRVHPNIPDYPHRLICSSPRQL